MFIVAAITANLHRGESATRGEPANSSITRGYNEYPNVTLGCRSGYNSTAESSRLGQPVFYRRKRAGVVRAGRAGAQRSDKLAKSLSTIQIPSTVQAVLASRIDRRSPDQKDLVQTLAVIGKEFLLRHIARFAARSQSCAVGDFGQYPTPPGLSFR